MQIRFTIQVLKEGRLYVAYSPELDLSSCGGSLAKAKQNLMEAVRLFLDEAGRMGTLDQVLAEAGYIKRKHTLSGPQFITTQRVSMPLSVADAKA